MSILDIGTAFLEGFLITVSPCVLSILPIVLTSSIEGGKWRPVGVILGLMASFIFFSLFIGQIFLVLGIRPEFLRLAASIIIFVFGLIMIFSTLGDRFANLTGRVTKLGNWVAAFGHDIKHFNGLVSGLMVGASLGLIWTPCIGPLVGSAMAQAASQVSALQNLIIIGSFCAGIALPMMLIAVLGKTIVNHVSFLKYNGKKLQQVFGSIIVLSILFTAKPSVHFVQDWVKFNIFGDKSVDITAVTGLNSFKSGCRLDV
jgi:cytochrome c biogenesis protein CcdA